MKNYKSFKRCNVVSFFELTKQEQNEQVDYYEELAEELSYLVDCKTEKCIYSLYEFMRVNNSRFDGVKGLSNTGGVGVILSSDCEQAVLQYI